MIKIIQRELLYFITLLVVLALLQHPDLLSSPMQRIDTMISYKNYFHPFGWTLALYSVIGVGRLIYLLIQKIKSKVKKD